VKKLFIFLALFFSLPFFGSLVFAQVQPNAILNQKIMPPRPMGNSGSFLGENHYYTITFIGNGEAVVVAKVLLTNVDNPVNSVKLQFPPNINPQDLVVYQILQEPQCIRYEPTAQPTIKNHNPNRYARNIRNQIMTTCIPMPRIKRYQSHKITIMSTPCNFQLKLPKMARMYSITAHLATQEKIFLARMILCLTR